MLTRRAALVGLAGVAAAAPRAGFAQTFPTHNVTIVVPYPAGGPVDSVARLLGQAMGADLGQTVVVDDRAGGAGVIGSVAVARAAPDGHTLVLGTNQTHATNQSLLKNCPYDAVKDFAPVARVADIQHVLVVKKDLPVKTVVELIALAKSKPGALNYGSTGVGSASHLAFELFKSRAGIDLQHVPFRGSAPMAQELLAGRLDASIATLPTVVGQIAAQELRPLAIASGRRAERLPEVPTRAEAGVSGVEADAWFALFAPAKTPPAVIDRLYKAVAAALATAGAKEALARQGMTVAVQAPADVAAALPAEVAKWAAVIKAANVAVE
jgi:tripartite-type tricarboxylate transporter receptor subunit TctC